MSNLIDIKNITVKYGQTIALKNACLTIRSNDFIGLIGPNGGGKTTLLKSILGLIDPVEGEVVFSDDLINEGSDIGYLSQVNDIDFQFPISVIQVVLSGLMANKNWFKPKKESNRKKAYVILEELGIQHLAHRAIGELSGGQMQRVFLARAIISDPKLLILDEPETFVDSQFGKELYEKLKILNERMAILLVSHDVGTICAHVKSIACINTNLHYHPSNKISAEQLASYNCPIQIITHGDVPHTVLCEHDHHN